MRKKDFMSKVTMVDLLMVSILLIAGLTVPVFRDLMSTMFFAPWIFGLLSINLVVDLLLLVLKKFKKDGNILQNMAIFFLILKLFVLFMTIFVSVIISLAN